MKSTPKLLNWGAVRAVGMYWWYIGGTLSGTYIIVPIGHRAE